MVDFKIEYLLNLHDNNQNVHCADTSESDISNFKSTYSKWF